MDTKISALVELLSADIAASDLLGIVDISDTTMAASGSTKKVQAGSLQAFIRAGLLGKPGGITIDGDSRTQKGSGGNNQAGDVSANFTHILAAVLGVSPDEIRHRGGSGARACTAARSTAVRSGTGMVAVHDLPPHMQRASQVSLSTDKAHPGLRVICWALNEFGSDSTNLNATTFAQIQRASIHGHRFAIARARIARLFPSDGTLWVNGGLVYTQGSGGSNGWSNDTSHDYLTCQKGHKTQVNGNVATITLPLFINAPTMLDVGFLGTLNAYSTLAAASGGATSPTTVTLAAGTNFRSTGSLHLPVTGGLFVEASYSSVAGAVFTLDAAGISAMSGKTLAATGTAVTMSTGAKFTLTGTVAAVNTGGALNNAVVTVGGQGAAGDPCHVVQRIPIVPADAGKTIILTAGGLLVGEECTIDYVGLEDVDPPPVLVFGVPAFAYGSNGLNGYIGAGADNVYPTAGNIATANTNLRNLVAEFDAQVGFVDLQAVFSSLYGATLKNAQSGAGHTLDITPNDPANCLINVGSTVRGVASDGTGGGAQEMWITDIDKTTIAPDWRCTATWGVIATPEGGSTVTHAAMPAGSAVFDARAFAGDRVHPSHEGMVVFAATALTALAAMNPTSKQLAVGAGYKGQKLPRLVDGGWIGPYDPTGTARTGTVALGATNTIYAWRVIVTEHCQLVALMMTTNGSAVSGALIQMGLAIDGPGVGGAVLVDSGDINANVGSNTVLTYTLPNPFELEPGTYWLLMQAHTAIPTFRGIKNAFNYCPVVVAGSLPTGAYVENQAVSWPGSGAGTALIAGPAASAATAVGVPATTALPALHGQILVAPRD